MTVYELIKELTRYEPDEEVMVIDCGEDVPILSVGDTNGRPVLFPWPQDGVGEG